MNWMRENAGRILVAVVVVCMLATISVSASRTGNDNVNDTVPERAVQRLTAEAQTGFSGVFGSLGDFFSGVVHFRKYQNENEKLKKENAELKESLSKAQLDDKKLSELKSLSDSLNYSDYSSSYDRVSADVISLDESGVFGNITVGAGKNDGIKKGSLVINEDGLVGKVISVTGSTAKVAGIIDSTISVSFYDQSDNQVLGMVTGNGKGKLEGYLFDTDKTIAKGAVLMTSGLGSYPAGIEIGTVSDVNTDKSTSQVTITAEPQADFYALRTVTVLTSKK
ncbi:MAG: rod shape-determining protein MreC [Eubacteriales bacterium]|nr:rod shape-determining protein MreC [Eubacteriales bacterium]